MKPEWRDRIPACVHVDGFGRPQLIHRDQNPVYYDVIQAYEQITGIPALINTSFNVHEEPIINRPEEALRALKECYFGTHLTFLEIYPALYRVIFPRQIGFLQTHIHQNGDTSEN